MIFQFMEICLVMLLRKQLCCPIYSKNTISNSLIHSHKRAIGIITISFLDRPYKNQ